MKFFKKFHQIYLRRIDMNKRKIIYVPMGADIIHSGHLNIINKAKKYGDVTVGLFTDSAIAEYKSFPLINYEQRLAVEAVSLESDDPVLRQIASMSLLTPRFWSEGPLPGISGAGWI